MDAPTDREDRFAAINAKLGDRIIIDPASIGADSGSVGSDGNSDGGTVLNKDGSPRKKRGRKPGSKSSGSSAKNSTSVKGIEKILLSAHMMMAGFFKAPEWALDNQEAEMLAGAIASVQDFYNFDTSAEVMLWMNVIGVCGAIYGPRIIVSATKAKKEKPKKETEQQTSTAIEGVFTPHHAPTE